MVSNSSLSEKNENQLVVSHLYLVKFVVSRMTMNLPPGITKDDLHAIGSMGLIDAAKKFDVSNELGFKFSKSYPFGINKNFLLS